MIAMISAALASGALVGFSLGLVGGGGSILATPLLLYVVGVAQPHIAIGTGALAVSVNAFANLAGHARAGNVRWRCAVIFAVVGTFGAFAGSSLGKLVDGNRLLFLFGLVMVAVGAMMLRPRRENAAVERKANLATYLQTAAVAFLAMALAIIVQSVRLHQALIREQQLRAEAEFQRAQVQRVEYARRLVEAQAEWHR